MDIQLITGNQGKHRKVVWAVSMFVAILVLLTILQDRMEANFQRSAFYLSESFLFSSFWWIFIPFLYGQYLLTASRQVNGFLYHLLLILSPVILHLLAFPALVWLISGLFYSHTFSFGQTLQFCLSEYLYTLILCYSVPYITYRYFKAKTLTPPSGAETKITAFTRTPETTLLVAEGHKRITIAVADILYFTANPPYINIHHQQKKYLYNGTLKSISEKINDREFVRIHKSTIVNIRQVQAYTSRLNGDYDLTLLNGTSLRVSRNYAATFKSLFQQTHRLTVK
jgi:LytTr DNA-binding domain